jgi:hypothetical protein
MGMRRQKMVEQPGMKTPHVEWGEGRRDETSATQREHDGDEEEKVRGYK